MASEPQQETQIDNIPLFDYYRGMPTRRQSSQVEQKGHGIDKGGGVEYAVKETEDVRLNPTDLELPASLNSLVTESQNEYPERDTQGADSIEYLADVLEEPTASIPIHGMTAELSQPKPIVRPPPLTTCTESQGFKFDRGPNHLGSYSLSYPVRHVMQRRLNGQISHHKGSKTYRDGNTGQVSQARSDDNDNWDSSKENVNPDRCGTEIMEDPIKRQLRQKQTATSEEAPQIPVVMNLSPNELHTASPKFAEKSGIATSLPFPEYDFPGRRPKLLEVRETRRTRSVEPLAEMESNFEKARLVHPEAQKGLALNTPRTCSATETKSVDIDGVVAKQFIVPEELQDAREMTEMTETPGTRPDEDHEGMNQDRSLVSHCETSLPTTELCNTGTALKLEVAAVAAQLAQMCQEESDKQKSYIQKIHERNQIIKNLENDRARLSMNTHNLKNSNNLLSDELKRVKLKSRKFKEHTNQIVNDQKTVHNEFKKLEAEAKDLKENFKEVEKQCKEGEAVIAKYRELFFVKGKKLYSEAGQRISDLEESLHILRRDLDARLLELQRERGMTARLQRKLDENSKIQEELTLLVSEHQASLAIQLAGHEDKIMDVLNSEDRNKKKIEECINLMNIMKDSKPKSPPLLEELVGMVEILSVSIESRVQAADESSTNMREQGIEVIEKLKMHLKDVVSDQKVQLKLNERIADLREINASLKENIHGRNARFSELEIQIERCQNDLDNCRLQLKAKTDELNDARAQACDSSTLRNQVSGLETDVVTLRALLSTANEASAKAAEVLHLNEASSQAVLKELADLTAKLHDAEYKFQTLESEKSTIAKANQREREKLRIDMETGFDRTFEEQKLRHDHERQTLLRREADATGELKNARDELSLAREIISKHEEKKTQLEAENKALETHKARFAENIIRIEDRLREVDERQVSRDVTLQIAREELLENLRIISELEIRTSKTALTAEDVRQDATNALQDIERKVEARANADNMSTLHIRYDQNEIILEAVSHYLRRTGILVDGVSISEWANSISAGTPPRRVHFQNQDAINVADDDTGSVYFLTSPTTQQNEALFTGTMNANEIDDVPANPTVTSSNHQTKISLRDNCLGQSEYNSHLDKQPLLKRHIATPFQVPLLKTNGKDEIPDSQESLGCDRRTPSRRSSVRVASRVGRGHLTTATQVMRNVEMTQTETTTLTTEYLLRQLEPTMDARNKDCYSASTFHESSSQKAMAEHLQYDREEEDDNLSGMTEMSPVIDYIIQHPTESHTEVLRQQQSKKGAFGNSKFSSKQRNRQRRTKNDVEDSQNTEAPPTIAFDVKDPIESDQRTAALRKQERSSSDIQRSDRKTERGPLLEIKGILKPVSTKSNNTHQIKDGNRNIGYSTPVSGNHKRLGGESASGVKDFPAMKHGFVSQPYNRLAIGGASSKDPSAAPDQDNLTMSKAEKKGPLEGRNNATPAGLVGSMMTSRPEGNRKRALSESSTQSERLPSKRISFAPSRRVIPDSQS